MSKEEIKRDNLKICLISLVFIMLMIFHIVNTNYELTWGSEGKLKNMVNLSIHSENDYSDSLNGTEIVLIAKGTNAANNENNSSENPY